MDLIVPGPAGIEIERERAVGAPRCPAASDGRYADSGRRFIHCGVSGDHYSIATSPNAAINFCCGEYTACPVWLAARSGETDVDLEKWKADMAQRRADRETRRQIEAGIRFDDRGVEAGGDGRAEE